MQGSTEGGFAGRTHKLVDGCYSFWQGALFPLLQQLQPLISQQQGLPLQMPPAPDLPAAQPSWTSACSSKDDELRPVPPGSGLHTTQPVIADGDVATHPDQNPAQTATPHFSSPLSSGLNQRHTGPTNAHRQAAAVGMHTAPESEETFGQQQPARNEAIPTGANDSIAADARRGEAGSATVAADHMADEVWLPDIPDLDVQTPEQQASSRVTTAQVCPLHFLNRLSCGVPACACREAHMEAVDPNGCCSVAHVNVASSLRKAVWLLASAMGGPSIFCRCFPGRPCCLALPSALGSGHAY